MRRFAAFATTVLSVALVAPSSLTTVAVLAQTGPQPAPEFRTGTAVVLLDVIARDKKGRPVRDLKAEELQVFENDQRCEIRSFRRVESQGTIEPGAAGAVGAPVVPVEPPPAGGAPVEGQRAPFSLVTLVFDRMNMEDSRLAEKAARDFVERGMDARTQAAVFTIGTGLGLVQPFTSEKEALLAAIAVATSGKDLKDRSLTAQAQQASRNVALESGLPVGGQPPEAVDVTQPSGERITGAGGRQPGVPEDRRGPRYLEWIARALRMADGLQRQMEGNWSLYPLLALVKAQAPLAGRKTLIFFSAGIQVPPNLQDVFRTVVSEANRSNVSVYSVDTRGLQSRSDIAASGAAVREAATASMMQQMKSASDPTTAQEMQMTDTALDSLTLNVQQTLSDLAEGTGGFLVANANDFGNAVDRLAADIGGYYEIQYSPALVSFDGGFRRINVKVTRKDVVLQSRRGYFALPPNDQIVLPYEMPLFLALSAATPLHDFAHQAAALHFAPGPEGTETAVVVEVPLAAIDFPVDKKKKSFEQRLTTLAVVKDAEGRVVERFSDEYPLSGPLDQLEAAKKSNAVLRRTVPLGAGRYTLETVSQVKGTGKTSVERTSFEVPAAGSGPQLSSLCLLRRADPLPADAPPSDDPFRYEGTRLVPHLAGPVSQAATPNLSFFARVYPTASIEMPKLTLDFVRDGKIVGRAQPPLPAPDASGRIAYVGGVPSSSFPPGACEVRLTLTQGTARVTESTRFELAP
ncbi:MAG TPA: VWA domain-containing protein [Vicinamibacteria bacterium]|nr:VWA domain-containing protein [Vicinamibacteria bacterium]